jgi:hypothetical protein
MTPPLASGSRMSTIAAAGIGSVSSFTSAAPTDIAHSA